MIYILTNEKGAGKTTSLERLRLDGKSIGGILSPVIEGKRFFKDKLSSEIFPMETADADNLLVGRFLFSPAAFSRAIKIIERHIALACDYIIIDEVGPLEMVQHKGFYDLLQSINFDSASPHFIIVIRPGLVDEFLSQFNVGAHRIISNINTFRDE